MPSMGIMSWRSSGVRKEAVGRTRFNLGPISKMYAPGLGLKWKIGLK